MKRMIALVLVLCALLALTGCTDGPLIATATPAPTPTPTPEPTPKPTPEPYFAENVIWPETSLTKLLPHFQPTLEVASQKGDAFFFGAFSEPSVSVINAYCAELEKIGFTVTTQAGSGLFVATGEVDGIPLTIQLFFDGSAGTIQISNDDLNKK